MHVLDGLYDIWELISMMRSSHMREVKGAKWFWSWTDKLNDDLCYHVWATRMAGSWMGSSAYRGEISSAEWQCGLLRTAHDVCGLIISRVEVDDSPRLMGRAHSPQAVGRPGMARPAGSCTTHEESFISRMDQ